VMQVQQVVVVESVLIPGLSSVPRFEINDTVGRLLSATFRSNESMSDNMRCLQRTKDNLWGSGKCKPEMLLDVAASPEVDERNMIISYTKASSWMSLKLLHREGRACAVGTILGPAPALTGVTGTRKSRPRHSPP
jgi:hypothetical protein